MAKTVSVLLAVLAVVLSLQADHMVSAGPFTEAAEAIVESILSKPELMEDIREKLGKLPDGVEKIINEFGKKKPEGQYSSMAVTAVEVSGKKLDNSEGDVILLKTILFMSLHQTAFELLKNDFQIEHQINTHVRQLCTTDSTVKQVALVYANNDELLTLHSGSNCLRIMLLPFA